MKFSSMKNSRIKNENLYCFQSLHQFKFKVLLSRVQILVSGVQHPGSSVQSPGYSVQCPVSGVQSPARRVQHPQYSVQSPAFLVQRPAWGCLCDNWKPNFFLRLLFNWRTFSRRVTARWSRGRAKSKVSTNQNSRNTWCQIVRRTTWRPVSRVERPKSRVQRLASRVQRPGFRVQDPAIRVQRPASRNSGMLIFKTPCFSTASKIGLTELTFK